MSRSMRRHGAWTAAGAIALATAVLATSGQLGIDIGIGVGSGDDEKVRTPQSGVAAATQARLKAAVAKGLPTEAEAREAAEQAKAPVEVTGAREERRTVVANPDGSFTAQEFLEPVRALGKDGWRPIDTKLAKSADGRWRPAATTVDLSVSNGGTGPFATVKRAGREFALSWPGRALPAPTVSGDTATYAEVHPGVDLVVRAEPEGFGHFVVVKTPEAAANPAVAKIEFGMHTEALTVGTTASGDLQITDAQSKGVVFEAAEPVMWDTPAASPQAAKGAKPAATSVAKPATDSETAGAAGAPLDPAPNATVAPVDMTVGKDALTLVPDKALLASPAAFPVVIDPPLTTPASAWTSVIKGMPNEQNWKFSGNEGMGKCPTDYSAASCQGIDTRRLMYTVPLTAYRTDMTILEATFSARVAHIYAATATAEPVRLYRVGGKNFGITSSSSWSNTDALWDTHLATVDKAIQPTACSSAPNLHFESAASGALAKDVQVAVRGGWTKMTFGLRAANETRFAEWKRMCGNAHLSVTYNRPPATLTDKKLSSNPGGACNTTANGVRVSRLPKLYAQPSDPDHSTRDAEPVKVEFKVAWTDAAGVAQSYPATTGMASPGATFQHQVYEPKGKPIPENAVVSYSARVSDGVVWSAWSPTCRFLVDRNVPGAPLVDSPEFPRENPGASVGVTGSFTIAPNTEDQYDDAVAKYVYDFDSDNQPPAIATPTTVGGPVTVQWSPQLRGGHKLFVTSYDGANNASEQTTYLFDAVTGTPPAAQWTLADGAQADTARDTSGNHPARIGPKVTRDTAGNGTAADRVMDLDGSADAYLETDASVVDTERGFSISAWVKPDSLTRDMTVASQNGSGEPGFRLAYQAAKKTFVFALPTSDVEAMNDTILATTLNRTCPGGASQPVCAGEWRHLAGVYDPGAPKPLKLYVDGQLRAEADRPLPWKAHGTFQMGRERAKTGYRAHWDGQLADVRAYNRATTADEVSKMVAGKVARLGYWNLDVAGGTGGTSFAEAGGGQALVMGGGAVHTVETVEDLFGGTTLMKAADAQGQLIGGGRLTLMNSGYAATATPPLDGTGSFSVTARVRLSSKTAATKQTVLSLPGDTTSRFVVRFTASPDGITSGHWELVAPKGAGAESPAAIARAYPNGTPSEGIGQFITVTYDALTQRLSLYVDGEAALPTPGDPNSVSGHVDGVGMTWPATGGLQVGRARTSASGWGDHLAGEVDDVRVYNGVLDKPTIDLLQDNWVKPQL
ncbi:LamG-like jellyroll fold domain-containing protein [Streptomyces sp. NPDC020412]|uniref:LamG-like jellyroll fold domain-containing protein n=1 Tax=Streptomyces sp. NPDC020412 TaxID=3365073 RepID=UPI0037B8054A